MNYANPNSPHSRITRFIVTPMGTGILIEETYSERSRLFNWPEVNGFVEKVRQQYNGIGTQYGLLIKLLEDHWMIEENFMLGREPTPEERAHIFLGPEGVSLN